MQIPFFTKSVYGNEHKYVADPILAQAISALTGKRTIDARDVSALSALGHSFVQVLPPSARNYGSTLVNVLDFAAISSPNRLGSV